ncbi:hypothetical protein CO251_14280 [Sulfobacillus sp. hq2]|nr:hypothetical protein CO251_14280 [Sulfobacillus sp. hq2]
MFTSSFSNTTPNSTNGRSSGEAIIGGFTISDTAEFIKKIHRQYTYFYDEWRRLVAANTGSAITEAQSLAQYLTELSRRRSHGWDREILAGTKRSRETIGFREQETENIYRDPRRTRVH